ncbi:aminodeoxychorismate synthase component I [Methylobrevis albus]|uniref:aminodeoxychorismate synthase n=1 Tax=Methylobrevis albus TaxID=2793297 RepID=A0A931MXX1_9HYPH|nr:aminodeoxychorismate synthase component I [Methylobrevis albus]MBH0239738.1 aminodeoxychorismate synthase component I [Methylobrevis albus]
MHVSEIDARDPADVAARLRGMPNLTFLDSAMSHPTLGRFSFVAADPFATLKSVAGRTTWNGEPVEGHPLDVLKEKLELYRQPKRLGLPPFQGGAAGFVSYDFGARLERLPEPELPETGVPEFELHFYDVVLAFDHREKRSWLFSTGWPEIDPLPRAYRAIDRAKLFRQRLAEPPAPLAGAATAVLDWRSNFERPAYEAAIARTIEYILAGDIFQANIAQRFAADLPEGFDPFAFYQRLRSVNAATFGAFLDYGDLVVASSSPERFVQVYDGRVETRPIKGTAKRSPDPAEDARIAEALLASEKDRAENIMIVDLLRNDLSRVCRPHTVHVPALCGLETYASVHHLVSVVSGILEDGQGVTDLLKAAFPGGSITGAPKIRAMEIIAEIERHGRGVYCGSIGYFGFDGNSDTSIAIRTVTFRGRLATFHAGGGITALSEPAAEYEETLAKGARLFEAFRPPATDAAGGTAS